VRIDFPPPAWFSIGSRSPSRVPALGIGHSLAFCSLTPCEVDDILGKDATPDSFGPNQCPLAASLQHQAPTSPTRSCSTFRRSHSFPPVAFTLRFLMFKMGHSLAFDSLRRVKPATSSGMDATPVSFRPSQSPLAAVLLRQAPLSIATARYRGDF